MKALYDVCAPAKLNLFLHITGRRPDGYHLLQSVFMLIDWCDTLHFEWRSDRKISREDVAAPGSAAAPLPTGDLCVRAALALQAAAAQVIGHAAADKLGAHITLAKNIPTQAGMGGGSSDAASTLLALNRLWRLDLPLKQLMQIALPLGADVPFFLSGGNAWVEGIGEKITPLTIPSARFVVAKPPDGLDTALIFSHPNLPRASETAIISGFAVNPFSPSGLFGFGRNDLQGVSRQLCPGIDRGLQWLESLGLAGRMTGSGSAVFAVLPGHQSDKAQLAGCPPAECQPAECQPAEGQTINSLPTLETDVLKNLQSQAPAGFQVKVCGNLAVHPLAGWAGWAVEQAF